MMFHIAVCDDEKNICDQIKEYISVYAENCSLEMKVDVFFNGEDLYEKLKAGQYYDLIFLDIVLYQTNGIDIGCYLRSSLLNNTTQLVFISSQQKYALELFKFHPLDFLIKPIDSNMIISCITKILELIPKEESFFSYKVSGIMKKISLNDILYFQSNARKVTVTYAGGEDAFYDKLSCIEKCIKECEGSQYLRLNSSVLVNYRWVKSIGNGRVEMEDGILFHISRNYQKEVLNKLNEIRRRKVMSWK